MTRNMNRETLEQKIAKTEKAISRNREQYDRLTAELEDLHKKKKAILNEEILKAIAGSSKSHEEILDFIQGKRERIGMDEYSRIIIEEYCMNHPKTKKADFLWKLVHMSYDVACEPASWQLMHLSQLISRERNPELRKALEDLDEFMNGY